MNDSTDLNRRGDDGDETSPERSTDGSAAILEQATAPQVAAADVRVERADAYLALVTAELDAAYRRATVILGDRFEAEDAVHDAAERAWRAWGSLRDERQFAAWFGRILVHVCRDRLRRRRRVAAIEIPPARGFDVADRSALAHVDRSADRAILLDALATLSPDERIAIVLRFEADLTVPEIGRWTGTREGTVKSRLHHAIRKLRERLGDRWEER